MILEDLSTDELKQYLNKNGRLDRELKKSYDKKELVDEIFYFLEQKSICEIKKDRDLSDELGKEIKSFLKSNENHKLKILNSYKELKNEKKKLEKRIELQKEIISKLPNILRFNVGQEVSISKSSIEEYPNSLIYTLICSNQYQPDQENYLNFAEEDLTGIFNFVRNKENNDSKLLQKYGFLASDFSNEKCLKNETLTLFNEDVRTNYQKYEKKIEKELKKQSNLLKLNFENYQKQKHQIQELVYNDVIDLNVGGKIFSISKRKLDNHKNTYFAPLASGQWKLQDNTFFIDRSFDHFHMIHYFLVHSEISTNLNHYFDSLKEQQQKEFLEEVNYYKVYKIEKFLASDFRFSKILTEEEFEFVKNLYPGKWRSFFNKF